MSPEVLDATDDLPGALVSESNVVDNASCSECIVVVTSDEMEGSVEREVDKLTATVENLSKQHDRLLVERDSQARQIALLTEKLKEKDKDTQTAHLTRRATESHIDKLQDNLNSKESDVVRLTCRVRELETEAASGAESHSHLLQENQRLHENFTLVAKEHKNMASDLENAVPQKKEFELQIQEHVIKVAKIEELLRTRDREREDLLNQHRSLISANADLLTQAEQSEKEQDSSDATLNSLRQQLARHMSVTTEQEQKLASLGATMAALQESLQHSAAEGSRLKEELQKSSDMRARLVEQVESLQDQLAKEQTVNNHISGHLRRLTENFWKRWTKEYLLQLRSAHFCDTRSKNNVKEGDVVLVHAENLPRQMWQLARVIEVYAGEDGCTFNC
ncbi:polyamine-modulated factor 1-binding protein 1-like [Dermacentor silvarum]|uniref:polyamine-modulated factor 1-binding protein 1-like n=1 Tax=Dermacentor silvarum TaxID=543639 RepID=UPI001898AA65|nr:polyamine-modulated factor 1-binding protein 1-like [Dermacentor silvarum]